MGASNVDEAEDTSEEETSRKYQVPRASETEEGLEENSEISIPIGVDSEGKIEEDGGIDGTGSVRVDSVPEEEEEEQIPLLFVDVNLGEGKMSRIVLYEGDKPENVAREFSKEHELDEMMMKKLTDLLSQQMAGVLSKIEEEEDEEVMHVQKLISE